MMKLSQFSLLAFSFAGAAAASFGLSGCRVTTGVSYGYGYSDVYGCNYYYDYYCNAYGGYYDSYGGYHGPTYGRGLGGGSGTGTAASESSDESRDLIDTVSIHEEAQIAEAGLNFAKTYGLSEDKGVQIARTLDSWEALNRKRSRTEADVADFSQRLYGVKVADAQKALDSAVKGDISGVEAMNAQVAQYWGTTPETSKKILKKWFSKDIGSYGISN